MEDTINTSTWIQSMSLLIIEGADYVESTLHVRELILFLNLKLLEDYL